MFLLDTGVLFAAIYQAHVHHEAVNEWLSTVRGYATCGMTQIGAFRLLIADASTHGCPLDPGSAHDVLTDFTSLEQHVFVPCPAIARDVVGQTRGYKAAFDDYLVQIARDSGHPLATLDRALANRWPEHAVLIQ